MIKMRRGKCKLTVYLFCECFSRTLDKVSSETSDKTESKVRLAANLIEVGQAIHDHAH